LFRFGFREINKSVESGLPFCPAWQAMLPNWTIWILHFVKACKQIAQGEASPAACQHAIPYMNSCVPQKRNQGSPAVNRNRQPNHAVPFSYLFTRRGSAWQIALRKYLLP
jgi:hypothetical protein